MARAHIIVVGNQKGGSGKSTIAMHLTVGLIQAGYSVGCIDLDDPQATFTRYLENRRDYIEANRAALAMPDHAFVERSVYDDAGVGRSDECARLDACVEKFAAQNDFIVIDTPGGDGFMSRHGHSHADTLITPLNDSFVDLDLLAKIDPDSHAVLGLSRYAAMVWEQKKVRAMRDGGSVDWIIVRNRMAMIDSRNSRAMEKALAALSKRIGFRTVPGFGERVVFRELFLQGLTLLDLRQRQAGVRLNMSHVAARQELRTLLDAIGLARREIGCNEQIVAGPAGG